MRQEQVLAIDLGASSGRVMLGGFDGGKLQIEELHRFSNDPVTLGHTMYWDILRLFYEVRQGLLKAKAHGPVKSIGVDTWGVDFGLLDRDGYPLDNPVHYRDGRTKGMLQEGFSLADQEWFYQITGNQFMEINTAFQLLALKKTRPKLLEQAEALLLMPDLFRYFLTGRMESERSIASTTQLLDMRKKDWSYELIGRLGLPSGIFQKILPSGARAGRLLPSIQEELGLSPMEVVAVAGHDTQCALAAVPSADDEFLFISCGTWSLVGTELDVPVINRQSQQSNLTNEIGVGGRYSFLKNIIGLWLIQESRRQWQREGREYSFGQLEQLGKEAEPFQSLIDPDDPVFVPAGDIPGRIRAYCRATGQKEPETEGGIVRCINQSLALKYRKAFEEIQACTGKCYQSVHVVGGGAQSAMLCQMTADACHLPVIAGPVEATVYGNVIVQYMADGGLGSLREAREVVRNSAKTVLYEPAEGVAWDEAYQMYCGKILASIR